MSKPPTVTESIMTGIFAAVVFGSVCEIVGWAFAPNKKPEKLTFEQRVAEEINNQPRSK